jgi:hypothetical protein
MDVSSLARVERHCGIEGGGWRRGGGLSSMGINLAVRLMVTDKTMKHVFFARRLFFWFLARVGKGIAAAELSLSGIGVEESSIMPDVVRARSVVQGYCKQARPIGQRLLSPLMVLILVELVVERARCSRLCAKGFHAGHVSEVV